MKSPAPFRLGRRLRAALFSLAVAAAPAGAHAEGASHASAALEAYLALWDREAPRVDTARLGEDLVLRYRHVAPPLRAEISGRDSVVTQVRTLARLGPAWRFRDLRVFPTLRPDVYFAQFVATSDLASPGAASEQTVVVSLELQGSRLVRVVEFANPAVAFAARPPG